MGPSIIVTSPLNALKTRLSLATNTIFCTYGYLTRFPSLILIAHEYPQCHQSALKKRGSPEAVRGRDLSYFSFKPLPRVEHVTAPIMGPATVTIPTPPPSSPAADSTIASQKEAVPLQNSSSLQSPLNSSKAPAVQEAPRPRLPKPVKVGQKDAFFQDSRCDWDGKYHEDIGTSTRKITFGCGFKLAE